MFPNGFIDLERIFIMKLTIDNFAKISHADISIDGITVIAGENNTGKSTVGKILFSLFNATSNFNDKILNQRMKEIQTTCWMNAPPGRQSSSSAQRPDLAELLARGCSALGEPCPDLPHS